MSAFAGPADKTRRRRVGLGVVLLLVTASAALQLLAEGSDLVRLVVVWLQAVTLVAAVRAAGATRTAVRLANCAAAAAAVAALASLVVSGDVPEAPAAVVNGLLVAVAPAVIAAGLLRQLRRERAVAPGVLAGVLAIYLLAGMFFSFCFGLIDAVDEGAMFGGHAASSAADRLYFSFVTLSTVGYGDLAPVSALPRALSVAEMLLGQIYLVTVVALIVGHLGRREPAVTVGS